MSLFWCSNICFSLCLAKVTSKPSTVNWLDLPSDVMANILSRIGVFDILENAQKVCTTWHQICKEPSMWRAVSMDNSRPPRRKSVCRKIFKQVVDRSQGQMVDVSMKAFCDQDLLLYIVDRSKQHRRLEIIYSLGELNEVWGECLKKLSSLEELSLCRTHFSPANIEAAGRFCPLLKTLKVNYYYVGDDDELAAAIGKNLPELRHLELIGDGITDVGLEAILDGCRHLESLDLRRCIWIDFEGDLGKRCSEQIKHLKLPGDSLEHYQHLEVPVEVISEAEDYGGCQCCRCMESDSDSDY
uniref:putative F-box/LRR-repeat protein 23 n=1 Tax=Erigeron canadensis TaxID=72917 RepID=UPI001CB978FC|nr:putative F-box/LRR-repeat protein 23 [Erigeron canadensis]